MLTREPGEDDDDQTPVLLFPRSQEQQMLDAAARHPRQHVPLMTADEIEWGDRC